MPDSIPQKAQQLNLDCQIVNGHYWLKGKKMLAPEARAFLDGYQCALDEMSDEKQLAFINSYNRMMVNLSVWKRALPQNFDMELFMELNVSAVETLVEAVG
jgi:hypothetical protein